MNSSRSSPDCRLFEAAQDESHGGSLSPLRQNHEDSTSPPLLLPSSSLLSSCHPLLSSPLLLWSLYLLLTSPSLLSFLTPPPLPLLHSFSPHLLFSPPHLFLLLSCPSSLLLFPPSPPLHLLHSSPDLLISPPHLFSSSSPALLLHSRSPPLLTFSSLPLLLLSSEVTPPGYLGDESFSKLTELH